MIPVPGQRPDWFDDDLFGFVSHFVEVQGHTVHYVDEGEGPVLLMLHGNPTWSFLYRDLIAGLRGSFRCIALDYPGMGLSTARKGYRFGPEEHREVVAAFVTQLDLTGVTLVLHDWGGPIGMGAATRDPDRYRALVLGNTWWWPLDDLTTAAFSWVMGGPLGKVLHSQLNVFVEQVIPRSHSLRTVTDAEMAMWRGPYPNPASREPTHVFPRRITESGPYLAQTAYEVQMTGLDQRPALLLWATKDPAFAKLRGAVERRLPHSTTRLLEGANHYWPDDAPDAAVTGILEWWGSDGPGGGPST
ncbi:MAG: alpha/beta fold hydrolase [Actinobacteria bacterium]|nr:alpha/beta fold hydrolase [Actinomycetota bacterium]